MNKCLPILLSLSLILVVPLTAFAEPEEVNQPENFSLVNNNGWGSIAFPNENNGEKNTETPTDNSNTPQTNDPRETEQKVELDNSVDESTRIIVYSAQQYNNLRVQQDAVNKRYETANAEFLEASRLVDEQQAKVNEISAQIEANQKVINDFIREEYVSGSSRQVSLLNFILDCENISDFLKRFAYIEKITEPFEKFVKENKELKQQEDEILIQLEENKRIKEQAFNEVKANKEEIDRLEAQMQQSLNKGELKQILEVPRGGYENPIKAAISRIGIPYTWGGKGENNYYFDCSGLTSWAYKNSYGVDIGLSTMEQYARGKIIPVSQAKPGDVLFRENTANPSYQHVAIYMGDYAGMKEVYVHAPCTGKLISLGSGLSSWTCALRFVEEIPAQ